MHEATEHGYHEEDTIVAPGGEASQALDIPDQNLEIDVPTPHQEDGGKRAWLQVVGSFLIFVNIW